MRIVPRVKPRLSRMTQKRLDVVHADPVVPGEVVGHRDMERWCCRRGKLTELARGVPKTIGVGAREGSRALDLIRAIHRHHAWPIVPRDGGQRIELRVTGRHLAIGKTGRCARVAWVCICTIDYTTFALKLDPGSDLQTVKKQMVGHISVDQILMQKWGNFACKCTHRTPRRNNHCGMRDRLIHINPIRFFRGMLSG